MKKEKKVDEKKKNSEQKDSKSLNAKQNKQLKWAVILMVLGLAIVICIPLIYNNFIKQFDYNSMKFQKTNVGSIRFYSTEIPLVNSQKQIYSTYLANFREDPRKLDYIKVDLNEANEITFVKEKPVYISLDDNLPKCPDNLIAVVDLASVLTEFGGFNINGALNNKTAANETHVAYVNCENSPNNTVIMIKYANETSITKVSENCYELECKECEINKVTEKFSLTILDRYMEFFEFKKTAWWDIF